MSIFEEYEAFKTRILFTQEAEVHIHKNVKMACRKNLKF